MSDSLKETYKSNAEAIVHLLKENERLIKLAGGSGIPNLVGRQGIQKILGIERTTVPHAIKVKGFPQPVTKIDGKDVWLESDIIEFAKTRRTKGRPRQTQDTAQAE